MSYIVNSRLSYIDIAKGLLILSVIYNHTGNLAAASGISNETIEYIPSTRFLVPFFMPAFFVIAGLCSNYEKDIKSFIISNAKALLIPAVLLLFVRLLVRYVFTGTFSTLEWSGLTSPSVIVNFGYWNWFLPALFTTKLLFYFVNRTVSSGGGKVILCLIIHIIGVFLYNIKSSHLIWYNYYFYQHAMMYLFYIAIGHEIKNRNTECNGIIHTLLFFSIYFVYLAIGRKIPSITSDPYLPIIDIIPHLLMSVSGSIAILYWSKKISVNHILEDFGKHSLVIYCLHFQFMFSFYQIFKTSLNQMGLHHTLTSLCVMYVFTAFGCLWISKALHTRRLKWILGKL